MRKALAILLFAAALASAARAQQQTPAEQALAERLNGELQYSLSVRTKLIEAQRDLAGAQARVKELEAQAQKPDAPPK